ncbi:MAG: acyltransferase family protein [Leptolyngbya sp. SIOISBB]|nr:acyltransferase family protein [Leptolyngbya sp. SIOISBB]
MQTLTDWNDRLKPFLQLGWQATIAPANELNGLSLDGRSPVNIERSLPLLEWITHTYFQTTTDGWEQIPAGQVMLIGSHNGGMAAPDTLAMTYEWFHQFGPDRPIYALMDPKMWQAMPAIARLAAHLGALRAEPRMALAALESGASLVIYPGGAKDVFRPYTLRHQIFLNGRRGFVRLALEYKLPIMPMISHGAHETLIVLAEIYDQLKAIAPGKIPWPLGIDPGVLPIYLGWPWGLAIGPLPNIPFPKPIHTRICPPIWFDHYGEAAARDRDYVDQCYQLVESTMQRELDRLVEECEGKRVAG